MKEGLSPWKKGVLDYKFTGYNAKLKDRARALRKGMTPQEKHLWYDFLKSYPVQFYRQRIIDNYIADFYCSKAKLVIELDGLQHFTDSGINSDGMFFNVPSTFDSRDLTILCDDMAEFAEKVNLFWA